MELQEVNFLNLCKNACKINLPSKVSMLILIIATTIYSFLLPPNRSSKTPTTKAPSTTITATITTIAVVASTSI